MLSFNHIYMANKWGGKLFSSFSPIPLSKQASDWLIMQLFFRCVLCVCMCSSERWSLGSSDGILPILFCWIYARFPFESSSPHTLFLFLLILFPLSVPPLLRQQLWLSVSVFLSSSLQTYAAGTPVRTCCLNLARLQSFAVEGCLCDVG